MKLTRNHSSRMHTAHFSDSREISLQRSSWTETPWTETPWTETPLEGAWDQGQTHLEGTWDQLARQEVTSYRDSRGQNDR